MKKHTKLLLVLSAALLMILAVSCGKQAYSEITQDLSQAKDPSLVGFWLDPIQTSKSADDVWDFRADGKLYFHQINSSGSIINTINGSYEIKESKLVVKLDAYTITYDSYEIVSDTLVLKDHGTESICTKYTKTIYK